MISFDDLPDGTVVTDQYQGLGVTFTGAAILRPGTIWGSGITLNEFEFPPHSGLNVLGDQVGPIVGQFLTPVTEVGGFFTYLASVTLTAFDDMGNMVGSVTSAFSENFVSSGNLPNELLQLSYAGGISRFEIAGDPAGVSLTLDDLTFRSGAAAVPGTTGLSPLLALLLPFVLKRFLDKAKR